MLVVAIAEEGSVTAAAERLGTSQPALSRALRSVELRAGTPLFERHARGMAPTPAGEAMCDHGRAVEAVTARAQRALDARTARPTVDVLIGVVPQISVLLTARALHALDDVEQDVRAQVKVGSAEELTVELLRGELDVVIGSAPDGIDLRVTPLFEVRPVLIARSGHPALRKRGALELDDLVGYRWVLPPSNDPITLKLNALFRVAELESPAPAVVTVDVPLATALTVESDLIAVLPHEAALIALSTGRVRELPIELPGPHGLVNAVRRRDMPERPEVDHFLRALEREVGRAG